MSVDVAHIRPARPKDAPALASAYEDAWRGAYQGIIPHLSLERMLARRSLRWWQQSLHKRAPLLVLDFRGEAAGYVTFGRCRMSRTAYQGLGLGTKLFDGARLRLGEMRVKGLLVWALADNEAACGFYLRLGGKPIAEGAESFGDTTLRKIAFAWA